MTLNRNNNKNKTREKPDTQAFFLRSLSSVTGTPPELLRPLGSPPALSSTRTLGFLNAQASRFLIHQHLCYLWYAKPRQWSPGASHPLPKEVEDFPRVRSILDISVHISNLLLTKSVILVGSIYVLCSPCRTLITLSPGWNRHFKSPLC